MSDAVAQLSRAIENDAAVRTWPLSLRGGDVSGPTVVQAAPELRIGGGRNVQSAEGFGFCAPYYGCFGYSWRSENRRLDAGLLNVRAQQGSQALAAEAGGTTMIPAIGLVIPLPGRSLPEACEQLGRRIADVLKTQAAEAPHASATRAAPVPGPPPTPPEARE